MFFSHLTVLKSLFPADNLHTSISSFPTHPPLGLMITAVVIAPRFFPLQRSQDFLDQRGGNNRNLHLACCPGGITRNESQVNKFFFLFSNLPLFSGVVYFVIGYREVCAPLGYCRGQFCIFCIQYSPPEYTSAD